jgi:Glycosyltransferase GT-D fold
MNFFARVGRFISRYVLTNPLYVLWYGVVYLQKSFVADEHLFTEAELARHIKKGKSVLRIGDGEINLMLGLRNHYQTFVPELRTYLKTMVATYRTDSPYMVAVPKFINMTNTELKQIGKFNVWMPLKVMFSLYFPKRVGYLDAHVFYYDEYFERVIGPAISSYKILLVTKQETIDKQRQNKKVPFTHWEALPTPESEMLGQKEVIQQAIVDFVQLHKDERVIVLLAAGPVGKWIGYELALSGIQCLDIGKVAEVMYTGESIQYLI